MLDLGKGDGMRCRFCGEGREDLKSGGEAEGVISGLIGGALIGRSMQVGLDHMTNHFSELEYEPYQSPSFQC